MSPTQNLRVRLNAIRYGARNINVYEFVALDGAALPGASPGSHIDVTITDGFIRQYSLLNSGKELEKYVIAVQNDSLGRGGSKTLHHESVVGSEYSISAPRNNFPLADSDAPIYLFAGGIGVTPLLNMYRDLRSRGMNVTFYYWARTDNDFLYRQELVGDVNVHLVPTDPDPSKVISVQDVIADAAEEAHLYCCGPAGMLAGFELACVNRDPRFVHQERFVANVAKFSSRSFTLSLARSKKTVQVGPEKSVLQACLEAGADVSFSCEEGVCGACEVKVLAGTVQHNDSVRSPSAHDKAGTMMICCSRSVGEHLTIDV